MNKKETADKIIKLRTSQKQLLDTFKISKGESYAEVFDRILEEKEELDLMIQKHFFQSSIEKYNKNIQIHMDRILAINLDIERQARDIVELELRKYEQSISHIQESLVTLANTKQELEELNKEYANLALKSEELEKSLQKEHTNYNELIKIKSKIEEEKNKYINLFNEANLDVNRLTQVNTDLKTTINQKDNQITTLKNDNNNLQITIASKNAEISSLKLLNQDLSKDKKYLQNSLDKLNNILLEKDQSK